MNKKLEKLLGSYLVFQIREWRTKLNGSTKKELEMRYRFYSSFILPGDICFDVGANVGNRIGPLLKAGARVIAIEPQEECIKLLRYKFGKKIEIVPFGMDAAEGKKTFHISDATTISSFSEEWINAVKSGRFKEHNWDKEVQVQMSTLDRQIEKYGVPAFIKIDVEGFETEVLKGLSRPVKMISYEYTVPEQTSKAIECLERIEKNSNNLLCNYSIGESMEFALAQWLPSAKMKEHLASREFIETGFGDIYVKTGN
jgi:FkbM family methyltransferase